MSQRDPSATVAAVGSLGIIATTIVGALVHDTRSAIVCVSVAIISIMAVMLASILTMRR